MNHFCLKGCAWHPCSPFELCPLWSCWTFHRRGEQRTSSVGSYNTLCLLKTLHALYHEWKQTEAWDNLGTTLSYIETGSLIQREWFTWKSNGWILALWRDATLKKSGNINSFTSFSNVKIISHWAFPFLLKSDLLETDGRLKCCFPAWISINDWKTKTKILKGAK